MQFVPSSLISRVYISTATWELKKILTLILIQEGFGSELDKKTFTGSQDLPIFRNVSGEMVTLGIDWDIMVEYESATSSRTRQGNTHSHIISMSCILNRSRDYQKIQNMPARCNLYLDLDLSLFYTEHNSGKLNFIKHNNRLTID